MKKEEVYKKSLRLLKEYLDETPQEQIDADLAKVKALGIKGPTFDEYLDILQNELSLGMKNLHNSS